MTNKPEPPNPFEPNETPEQQMARVGRMIHDNANKRMAKAGTPEPRPSEECIVCGATLLPIETPPHCEDCVVTDEHYDTECGCDEHQGMMTCRRVSGAGIPDPRPTKCRSCEIWKCESPGCKCKCHEAGTPETPSGQLSIPGRWENNEFIPEVKGETPSALSEFVYKWANERDLEEFGYTDVEEICQAYAATLREEIEDLRGMVRDERALRKGQLEEVEEKLATAERTVAHLGKATSALLTRAEAAEAELARVRAQNIRLETLLRDAQSWITSDVPSALDARNAIEAALRPGAEKL